MNNRRYINVKTTGSSLERLGIDVEYFQKYVNEYPYFHSVNVVLLSFIMQGSGSHLMDSDVYEESGGSLGVTHYGQKHTIVTDDEGMEIMNIYLDLKKFPLPRLPSPLDRVLPLFLPIHPVLGNRLNRIVRIPFGLQVDRARELVFAIQSELKSHEHGFEESVRLYFTQFLIICCRQALKKGVIPSLPSQTESLNHIERVRKTLDNRYKEQHSLQKLSELAGVAPTYLCRAFKKYTGKSLIEYLLDRRVQASMIALRAGNDKIMSIAYESGFNDLAHFNRIFKTRVGQTPSDYRNYK